MSLTEDPEFEIPVCRDIVKRYEMPGNKTGDKTPLRSQHATIAAFHSPLGEPDNAEVSLPYSPFSYRRRETAVVHNMGGNHVPVVVADYSGIAELTPQSLQPIGYTYNELTDKWSISDGAADYIYTGAQTPGFALPGTLQVICDPATWEQADPAKCLPIYDQADYLERSLHLDQQHFVRIDANHVADGVLDKVKFYRNAVLVAHTTNLHAMASLRRFLAELMELGIRNPVILQVASNEPTVDEQLIHYATEAGGLLLDGFGDGIRLCNTGTISNSRAGGRTYLEVKSDAQFLNNTAFSILQATRTRISKTEYISCPSCGRTLFDLQETTAKIRAATNHLKGVKIAIMGCIVNGPGEMADADFGYVGSGPGKITLYKGKEVVKKGVPSEIAVDELIGLLKESEVWVEG